MFEDQKLSPTELFERAKLKIIDLGISKKL